MSSRLLTPEEVANQLQIALTTVWKLGREGALRGAVVRIGTRMRFRPDAVAAYIAAGGSDRR